MEEIVVGIQEIVLELEDIDRAYTRLHTLHQNQVLVTLDAHRA